MRAPALNPRVRCGHPSRPQPVDSLPDRLRLDRAAIMRGLVARLITQALIDLQLFESNANRDKQASANIRRNAALALLWLNGQLVAQRITFAECCDMLGFDPVESRDKLLAQVDPAALAELGHTASHTPVNRINAALASRTPRRKASDILSKQGRRRLIPSGN